MSYQVSLDTFHGPLDLLLYLVKRNEVDIHDIPIALLTQQFLEYLEMMRELDVELAGEFVVMAATLMEIKARNLLPVERIEDATEEPDPRRQLVKQLLEYRKYKDAAAALEQKSEAHAARIPRTILPEPNQDDQPAVRAVELWDLVNAFARLMRETQSLQTRVITIDDTPQEVYERQITEFVRERGRINFRNVFQPPYSKSRLIGLFLAILELIKQHILTVEQDEPFGEIWLLPCSQATSASTSISTASTA